MSFHLSSNGRQMKKEPKGLCGSRFASDAFPKSHGGMMFRLPSQGCRFGPKKSKPPNPGESSVADCTIQQIVPSVADCFRTCGDKSATLWSVFFKSKFVH